MDKFKHLRENRAVSRNREEFNDNIYGNPLDPDRFANAWSSGTDVESEYATFGVGCDDINSEDEEKDDEDSIYQDMTFDPGDASLSPVGSPPERQEIQGVSLPVKRGNSLNRPVSLDISGTPPLYRALMNRLSVNGAISEKRKSLTLGLGIGSPTRSSPVLHRRFSAKSIDTRTDVIPQRDKNVINPLFTPSPSGTPGSSPCGSPAASYNFLAQRLKEEQHMRSNTSLYSNSSDVEDIYDTPKLPVDRPPELPPKKRRSLLRGPRSSFKNLTRAVSVDTKSLENQVSTGKERKRQTSLGDQDSKNMVSLTNIETTPYTPEKSDNREDQFVGTMIEKSDKSDRLEKKLGKKGKKKQIQVENAKRAAELDKKIACLPDPDQMVRTQTLALRDDWDEIDNMIFDLQCDITATQHTIQPPSLSKSKDNSTSIEPWLKGLQLAETQVMMEINGWDNINFINGVMAKEDLVTLGINNEKIKRMMLKSIEEDLPNHTHEGMPETVEEWLNDIDLSRYLSKFTGNRMGFMSRVLEIWEVELTSILNIEPIGHRKRIMGSIRELRKLQTKLEEACEQKKKDDQKNGPKWFHTKEDLISGVDYAVKYFGCTKLEGKESSKQTAALCQKQQSKFKNQKAPEFRLRISTSGITFIDKQTQTHTSDYSIEDISFVSRDKTDLLIFSFISSDRKMNIKMCHVFKAFSRNQAFEACSTVAQAFEVAFEQRQSQKQEQLSPI